MASREPVESDLPLRAGVYVCALLAAWILGPRGPVYWDSFGYVTQALTGWVGGLALGRPVFVWLSHGVAMAYLGVGGSVWSLEPVLRSFWLLVSAAAAPAAMGLACEVGLSQRAAVLAGLAVAFSPAMAHTSAAVLTDGPSAAISVVVLWLAARAIRLGSLRTAVGAGVALGIAVGLREQALFAAVTLVWWILRAPKPRRAVLVLGMGLSFAVTVALPIAVAWRIQPGYWASVANWVHSMARERQQHVQSPHDVAMYGLWLLALGPVPLAAACAAWVRRTRELVDPREALVAVCLPAVVQLVALAGYPDIAYSPRYLLPALVGAVAIPAAMAIDGWIGLSRGRLAMMLGCVVLPCVVASPWVRASEAPLHRTLATLPAGLLALAPRSAIVTGQPCPAIAMIRAEFRVALPNADPGRGWRAICPGWTWPEHLPSALDAARADGVAVVIDERPTSWLGAGQRARLREATQYAERHPGVVVWR